MTKEKVYHAEFMEYTNITRKTVAKYTSNPKTGVPDAKYLDVGPDFLVKESDIEKYREYGKGYKSLIFAGYIEV